MYRGIKLNKKEWEIESAVSVTGEGGSRYMILEPNKKFTFTKGSIQDILVPKDIDFIEFDEAKAFVVLSDGFNFTIPCETKTVDSKAFIFSLQKKEDTKIWKMFHCLKEPIKKLEFIRIG